jgi:hypothetical protein
MKPCAQFNCPALATRGSFCPVHLERVERLTENEEPVSLEETRAAIETRKRIARLYHHEDR